MTKVLFKIVTLLVLFNGLVLADSVSCTLSDVVEVSLDSFSALGIVVMVVLTSLLGVYFMRDEFC